MADDKPFRYRPINVDDQSYIEIVKSSLQKKNILEDNEEYDKKAVSTPLTPFYLNTLTGPGLAYLDTFNRNRKKKGLEPFEPEFLKKYFNYGKNLEDDEIDIGCAGGIDVTANRRYIEETTPKNTAALKIAIKGLQGGHSGMDIHKGFGNANKIMNRLLYHGFEHTNIKIAELEGGSLRNAIPRESFSTILIDKTLKETFLSEMNLLINSIKDEFNTIEPNLTIDIVAVETPLKVMNLEVQKGFIKSVYAALNGVYKMSPDIPDLVETSNNIARIVVENGEISIACLTRSSSESSKEDLTNSLKSCFELAGFKVEFSGSYPGWQPNVDSEILQILTPLYEKLFGEKAKVAACHAGLECGILGQNYPLMDMISFGPTIRGAHSPDERVSISSVQKFWKFLLEILKNIPERNS